MVSVEADNDVIQEQRTIFSCRLFGHSEEDAQAQTVPEALRQRESWRVLLDTVKLQSDVDCLISIIGQVESDMLDLLSRMQSGPQGLYN